MMENLETKWIRSVGRKTCIYESHKSPARLGLRNMRDGLILVIVGICIGILLSLAEVNRGQKLKQKRFF